ncbi:hypothetical protein DFH07DRAFT_790548 [Mycena maculata]|uniref:Secreted protein n=1 Tax=Mycena maculata TaxID=230809 RepID=A0AAD7P094_9AGAR|nr:hypothetical protein DFH07DRAFT_790548 [Mycena maculata]
MTSRSGNPVMRLILLIPTLLVSFLWLCESTMGESSPVIRIHCQRIPDNGPSPGRLSFDQSALLANGQSRHSLTWRWTAETVERSCLAD